MGTNEFRDYFASFSCQVRKKIAFPWAFEAEVGNFPGVFSVKYSYFSLVNHPPAKRGNSQRHHFEVLLCPRNSQDGNGQQ